MPPLAPTELRGNWATLLLPINEDESINRDLLEAEIDYLIGTKVSGIYSNGSAGEFYAQSEEEFELISRLLAEKCERSQMPFQIGASHPCAQLSRERLRRAKVLRPSAFQVVLPDWFAPSWPEIIAFLQTMAAEAWPIPLVVYNPGHAKRRLTPAEWLEIADAIPGIAGIKVPNGNVAWYQAMQPVMKKLSVFIPGHTLAFGLANGAQGAYSNVACLSPAGAQRWYELCVRDLAAGQRQEEKIQAFWKAHVSPLTTVSGLSNMAADKAVAVAGGWLPGLVARLRWPYRGATLEMVQNLAMAARNEVPELFQ